MNNEIKEILDILKKCYNLKDENFDNYISLYQLGLLLDYITNLQQENEYLNNELNNMTDYAKDLQQENEKLKKALNCKEYFSATMPENTEFVILTKNNYDRQQKDIQLELIDYKSRLEKAIEYIENPRHEMSVLTYQNLLNILQNGSENDG